MRLLTALVVLAALPPMAGAQVPDSNSAGRSVWRRAGTSSAADLASLPASSRPPAVADLSRQKTASSPKAGPLHARVTKGAGTLPNDQGQIWREYDIRPYTVQVTSTNRPEQAVVEWVFRETGYEAWHSQTVALLNADQKTLRVYHTPEMQALVAGIVDRFVKMGAETQRFSLRVVSVGNPEWRAHARHLLRPAPVQSQGISAWLMVKEDAATLMSQMRQRADYREHSSPYLLVNNGQSAVVSTLRGRTYIRDVTLRKDAWPGFQRNVAQLDEGFSLEMSPLLSTDGRIIDAAIKCHVDQVERMVPVMLDVPTVAAPRQQTQIEVPQVVHYRMHERFRWPADRVLLIDLGMVALPDPVEQTSLVPGLPLPVDQSAPRANLLIFVESKPAGDRKGLSNGGAEASQASRYPTLY